MENNSKIIIKFNYIHECSDINISSLQKLKFKIEINTHRENLVNTIRESSCMYLITKIQLFCTTYLTYYIYLLIKIFSPTVQVCKF